jgi:hypothetical protein
MLTKVDMRARDRAREPKLLHLQLVETAQLAALLQQPPRRRGSKQADVLRGAIQGLAGRVADRREALNRLEAARLAHDGGAQAAIVATLVRLAPWCGTAGDLLASCPACTAGSPSRLARILRRSVREVWNAGLQIGHRREAGSGQRLFSVWREGADEV